jgi:hypothetical protein
MIGSDASEAVAQASDQPPVEEGPGRVGKQAQEVRPVTLVHVVDQRTVDIGEVPLERIEIVGDPARAGVRRG